MRDAGQNLETHQHGHQGALTTGNLQVTTPDGQFIEEGSVISAATTTPEGAKERLERMMILRAQMVEVEKRLDQLKEQGLDEQSPQVKAVEKTLRRFRRQAERRYAAGVLFFKSFMRIMVRQVLSRCSTRRICFY